MVNVPAGIETNSIPMLLDMMSVKGDPPHRRTDSFHLFVLKAPVGKFNHEAHEYHEGNNINLGYLPL